MSNYSFDSLMLMFKGTLLFFHTLMSKSKIKKRYQTQWFPFSLFCSFCFWLFCKENLNSPFKLLMWNVPCEPSIQNRDAFNTICTFYMVFYDSISNVWHFADLFLFFKNGTLKSYNIMSQLHPIYFLSPPWYVDVWQ